MNHRAIYAAHPDIGAIVTAYPVNATAFSVTDAALDARTIPESYVFLRQVRRVPYGVQFGDGRELAEQTTLRDPVADPGKRRRAGLRDERPGRLRPPGSARVNRRGHDQQPPDRDDDPDARRGHRRAGGSVLQEAVIPPSQKLAARTLASTLFCAS